MNHLKANPILLRGSPVAFSHDGQWLAAGSDDATVRLWSLDMDQVRAITCKVAGRNFTRAEWARYFSETAYPARQEDATCLQWPLKP